MFNITKLNIATKRASTGQSTGTTDDTEIKVRRRCIVGETSECFPYEKKEPASTLRQAMTIKLNERERERETERET